MPLTRAWLLALLPGAVALSCGRSETPGADGLGGGGLVLLPSDEPLPPGVPERDPRLSFWDFGHVPDGDVVRHVFHLRNDDPREVAIRRVVPGCGCSVASLRYVGQDGAVVPGEPVSSKAEKLLVVPAGVVFEIEVKIDTRTLATKNADKLIVTNVATDSPSSHYLSLEVHIFVERPFEVVPGMIQLGKVAMSAGGEGSVEIVQAGGFRHRIRGPADLPPLVHGELASEERAGGQTVWVLRAGFDPPLAPGGHRATIALATETAEGAAGRPLEVPIQALAVPDLTSEPERLVFAAPRGESVRARAVFFSLLAGHRLRVLSTELPEDHRALFEAAFEPLEPDDEGRSLRWAVTLATRPPLSSDAPLSGELLLRLDDPQHPSFALPYVVHLR